ncbi:hypothetical protein M0805_007003 [Coniferiporia weirii]|nr:hypothetical protein M0805_007003 [Coniferiporia weirii]
MSSEDTEVLLVSLVSLLEPNVPTQSELLNALVDCEGNVEAAAQLLRSSTKTKHTTSKKRKRTTTDLEGWLSGKSSGRSKEKDASKSPANASKASKDASHANPGSAPCLDDSTATAAPRPQPAGTPSNVKPVDLMSILRAPPSERPSIVRNLPITLTNPAMVAHHVPCTLHHSILPPELACELFYTLLDAAQGWSRNKWWLFDRLVQSPHRTSFFARVNGFDIEGDPGETWKEAAQLWYNGRKTESPTSFPEGMEAACQYVERIVNEEIQKRVRYPLEWGGPPNANGLTWRANVAASNCYEGSKEGVGFHSDQLTFLGPYPTIASLSLGTTRIFRLREAVPSSEANKRQPRTYNIPLSHNSLIIMHASAQERFKHCIPPQSTIDVFHPPFPRRRPTPSAPSEEPDAPSPTSVSDPSPPTLEGPALVSNSSTPSRGKDPSASSSEEIPSSNCRINVTFRFYRPDFMPSTTPRCKCGVPCILRPDMKRLTDHREDGMWGKQSTGKEKGKAKAGGDASGSAAGQKGEEDFSNFRYWWTCYAGAQNEGKGCGMWKVMDVKAEGRGPFIGDLEEGKIKENVA